MTVIWHTHEIEQDGFTVRFEAVMGDEFGRGDIDQTEEQYQEMIVKLDNFELYWFDVRVSAHKCGIELAEEHLGSCCYTSYEEFYAEDDGYWGCMKDTVLKAAKEQIEALRDYD
jgi:hypothetical protein